MSFIIKDDSVLDRYNEIWNKIKKTLNIKFHSIPVYDEKCIQAKVREFNGVIKTNFSGDEIPKNNPQVYLEECKYKTNKIEMSEFINTELESESELESDTELESKSKLESDSE